MFHSGNLVVFFNSTYDCLFLLLTQGGSHATFRYSYCSKVEG